MATRVTIQIAPSRCQGESPPPQIDRDRAVQAALDVFHTVQSTCTRFDPSSPLMRANATPRRWHRVPETLFMALEAASRAHQRTAGRFDPRVLEDLVTLGYDRTLVFTSNTVGAPRTARRSRAQAREPWRPRFRGATREVFLGDGVDLGGIGKGLAVRWASQRLAPVIPDFLVEAGGDCYCAGRAPDGDLWRIGVEDPAGGDDPLAVLALSGRAATTSSIRLRRWKVGNDYVHHLIDPRTGRPGGQDLAAVTVIGEDPADCEVTSKVLFLAGRSKIKEMARRRAIAALWVDVHGDVTVSPQMEPYISWQR